MKVYVTDETTLEFFSKDIPPLFIASGPEYRRTEGELTVVYRGSHFDDVHFMGAVEGLCAPADFATNEIMLDDEEYPARRVITRLADGTLVQEARFGRDMKWFMAINRNDDALALAAVQKWLGEMIGPEGE